jgi:hypothetical protein
MVSIDGEGDRPQLTFQCEGGSVGSVRAFVAAFLRKPGRLGDAFLEFCVSLAQVVKQARQFCVMLPLEESSELFSPASHTQEMSNERLIRVGEDLSGAHSQFSLQGLIAVA